MTIEELMEYILKIYMGEHPKECSMDIFTSDDGIYKSLIEIARGIDYGIIAIPGENSRVKHVI